MKAKTKAVEKRMAALEAFTDSAGNSAPEELRSQLKELQHKQARKKKEVWRLSASRRRNF
ncbi:MAG: hypothetical protein Q7S10_02865 [bacterium]|nr:hypothetical protein [bacterium]